MDRWGCQLKLPFTFSQIIDNDMLRLIYELGLWDGLTPQKKNASVRDSKCSPKKPCRL